MVDHEMVDHHEMVDLVEMVDHEMVDHDEREMKMVEGGNMID